MVTDAIVVDLDGDQIEELIVAQEWGSIKAFNYKGNKFNDISEQWGLQNNVGWWFSLAADDIDLDGDMDLIAGNLGLNYKYKASKEAPFHLYLNDFDQNNSNDIVLGYHEGEQLYPLRGRECTSGQMPFVKKKFQTYEEFGRASLQEVYGESLESARHISATNFANSILINEDMERFSFAPLPNGAQISSINKILTFENKENNHRDLLLFGNLYGSEVETPRNDASYGHFLTADGNGDYKSVSSRLTGLYVKGDVRGTSYIHLGKNRQKGILLARNNETLLLYQTP